MDLNLKFQVKSGINQGEEWCLFFFILILRYMYVCMYVKIDICLQFIKEKES